jgi:FAD/FMN-containing dehydrogenase
LNARTDAIEGGIERAEEAQAEAQRTLEGYRAQLAEARHEAAQLREHAREQGAAIIAEMRERAEAAARDLFALARELDGTASGEHGIGVLKRGQLSAQWAPAAVAAHRAVKRVLDPKGLFNPGKKEP